MIHLFRVIHILTGVFWVGGVLSLALFILPSARAVGPAAGPIMSQLTQVRQMPRWFLYAGLLTLASGYWMYFQSASSLTPGWMASGMAKVLGMGAVFGTIAWFMGMTMNAPLAKKIGAETARLAAAGGPPSAADAAALKAMHERLGKLAVIGAALLVLATTCMAVARYVP